MAQRTRVIALKAAVWAGALAPLLWGLWRWFFGDRLGANPVEVMIRSSGYTAIVILIASLAVTPLRRITGFNDLQKVRRLTGLWAFAWAAFHLGIYLYLDQALAWRFIMEDVTERPFIIAGSLTFLLLLPLAATSTRASIRRLGKNWVRLHRLAYPAALLGLLHYAWGQKADLRGPVVWGAILFALLGYRIWAARDRRRKGESGAGSGAGSGSAGSGSGGRLGAPAKASALAAVAMISASCAAAPAGPHGAGASVVPAGGAGSGAPAAVSPHGAGNREAALERAVSAPAEGEEFAVFTGTGAPASLDEIVGEAAGAEVIFFGEEHNDQTAHRIQTELLRRLFMAWGVPAEEGAEAPRSLALSLEMFERDVQYVLDEYLGDLITEDHFLSSARPWDQYELRYRPAVEFARVHGLPVVAANAPRRYVNRASRLGRESLAGLPPSALATLPPLPYPGASEAYQAEWDALMGPMAEHMSGSPLDAQTLWDAAMGWSVAEVLDGGAGAGGPDPLVLHFAGSFHVRNGTGTPEALEHYRPGSRVLLVVAVPGETLDALDPEEAGTADYVIVTRPTPVPDR
jgi:DMSO/TMAO reductase YedYZ heme-binding membrane subunit/uncharacterized iron-regulated protein